MGFGSSRHAFADANRNVDGKQYANSDTNCNCDRHGYSYRNSYTNGNGNAYALADLNPTTYT